MDAEGALLRAAVADLRLHDHERRTVPFRPGRLDRGGDRPQVVAVGQALDVPAVALEHLGHVVGEGQARGAGEADAVRVVEDDELAELEVPGQRGRLVGDALHEVAVAGEDVGVVVHDLVAGPVEPRGEVGLGHRHAHRHREALAEGAGRRLDARRVPVLRVARRAAPPLPELLQLVERQVVAGEVEQAVEEGRAVAGREHEAVPVGPARLGRAVLHGPGKERVADGRRAQGKAGVAGVGVEDGVDGQRADRVHAELVERGVGVGHRGELLCHPEGLRRDGSRRIRSPRMLIPGRVQVQSGQLARPPSDRPPGGSARHRAAGPPRSPPARSHHLWRGGFGPMRKRSTACPVTRSAWRTNGSTTAVPSSSTDWT